MQSLSQGTVLKDSVKKYTNVITLVKNVFMLGVSNKQRKLLQNNYDPAVMLTHSLDK
jgi:hypothetical protein